MPHTRDEAIEEPMTPPIVRTLVPLLVGLLGTAMLEWFGLTLPVEPATEAMTIILSGLYYAAVHWLERRYPEWSILLGSTRQPAGYHKRLH